MKGIYRHHKGKLYRVTGEGIHSETLETLVVYKALYPNPLGQDWVRPKEMFVGRVLVGGAETERFQNLEIQIEQQETVAEDQFLALESLLPQVFGPFDISKLKTRLADKDQVLLLIALVDKTPVGFKLGYQKTKSVFYSWLGGVRPDFQGMGIGKALMKHQHTWCVEQGYEIVETKTLNRWKSMLILNINSGFEVKGTELRSNGETKIILEKHLEGY